ncbi:hypothetical protein AB7C87_14570 [Natrarchaeobius sp. A-rgal3]
MRITSPDDERDDRQKGDDERDDTTIAIIDRFLGTLNPLPARASRSVGVR